jgi:ABC-2 type transport system permease protein
MKVLAIGYSNIKRMLRERSNIFFVFIFPLAIILLIGAQFGGGVDPALGVFQEDSGQISESIADTLQATDGLDIVVYEQESTLVDAIERGYIQAGVILPAGMDSAAAAGEVVDIGFVARSSGLGVQIQSVVEASVAEVMKPVGAAQYASIETGQSFESSFVLSSELVSQVPGIDLEVSAAGESVFPDTLGQFDLGASSQLVLFVFLTALAGSAALILSRRLGISERMLSTPTSIRTIVVGESVGRFGVALVQGIYIIILTLLMFRVNWGDPIAAILVLLVFAAVGAGAGVLMGATFSNDQQASGVGVILSIGLAALGGCMMPLDFYSDTLLTVAHLTPHAWANDAYAELVRRGGTTMDILPELGVLSLYAVVLLALAAWRLRVAITRP